MKNKLEKLDEQQKKRTGVSLSSIFSAPENYYNDDEKAVAKVDPAWAKAALYFRTGHRFGHPEGSRLTRSVLKVYEQLEVFRERFLSGNTFALLLAIQECSAENLPLPTWLSTAYRETLDGFLSVDGPTSLDEIFKSPNLPHETPKKRANARQDWKLGGDIYYRLCCVINDDTSVKSLDAAFNVVLAEKDYGIKKTKAKSLVSIVEKNQLKFLGKREDLSRLLMKRRKLDTASD